MATQNDVQVQAYHDLMAMVMGTGVAEMPINVPVQPEPEVDTNAEVNTDTRVAIQKGKNGKPAVGRLAEMLEDGVESVEWYTKHRIKYEHIRLVLQWDFGFKFVWNADGKYHVVTTPSGNTYHLFTQYANNGVAGRKEFVLVS